MAAMQIYIDEHVAPVWGTPAKLVETTDFVKGAWAIVFLDNADQPGALAYHDLTPDGLPESKVFVKTTLDDHELVSVSASHELVEMLVDPGTNLMTTGPDAKTIYAYESADPVESLFFDVQGMSMSDFIYPSYFETFHKTGSVQFDHMNKVNEAVSDSVGRIPDCLQEREVEPGLRFGQEGEGLREGRSKGPPQRNAQGEEVAAGGHEEHQAVATVGLTAARAHFR